MKKINDKIIRKISDIFLTVFGVGVTICLFAGGITLLAFIVAMCLGGETATKICIFIHKTYFPIVIQFAAIFTGFGLLGMYLTKKSALTVAKQPTESKDEISCEEADGAVSTVKEN